MGCRNTCRAVPVPWGLASLRAPHRKLRRRNYTPPPVSGQFRERAEGALMCLCQRDAFARKCICLHLGLVRYPGLAQRLQTVRLIHTDHLPHQNRRNGRKRQLGVNIVPTYRTEARSVSHLALRSTYLCAGQRLVVYTMLTDRPRNRPERPTASFRKEPRGQFEGLRRTGPCRTRSGLIAILRSRMIGPRGSGTGRPCGARAIPRDETGDLPQGRSLTETLAQDASAFLRACTAFNVGGPA